MLQPFNTVPQVVVTRTIKLFLLLLHNYTFAIVMNWNVNICVFWWSQVTPVKGSFYPQRGQNPQVEKHWYMELLYSVFLSTQNYSKNETTHVNIKHIFTYIQTTIIKSAQYWGYKTSIYLLLFQRTWVRFPAPTQQLTTLCNSVSGNLLPSFGLLRHCIYMVPRHTCRQNYSYT